MLKLNKTAPSSPALPISDGSGEAQRRPRLELDGGTSRLTSLGVSWLNGQLRAVAYVRGKEPRVFEASLEPTQLEGLPELLRQVVAQTGFPGREVSLGLAHPRLLQLQVEAPPAKGALLTAYLKAQVERLKSFEESAVWAVQGIARTQGGQGLLLHVLPQSLLEQLTGACAAAGLRLVALVPVLGIMQAQLGKLSPTPQALVMATADFDGLTPVLLGRTDGSLLVARTINSSWSLQPERLLTELERTLLFAGQQLEGTVAGVWTLGGEPPEALQRLAAGLNLRAEAYPPASEPHFWARQVAQWPSTQAPNLISKAQLAEPKRRAWLRLSTISAGLLALNSVLVAMHFQSVIKEEQQTIAQLQTSTLNLQGTQKELQRLQETMERYRLSIKALRDQRLPSIAAWFLVYLEDICPVQLQLTGASISQEGAAWRFRIQGQLAAGPDGAQPSSELLQHSFAQFTARLSNGPLHAQIESRSLTGRAPFEADPPPDGWMAGQQRRSGAGSGRRPERPARPIPGSFLAGGGRGGEYGGSLGFQLEGWVR
jgi:hypothetical protein